MHQTSVAQRVRELITVGISQSYTRHLSDVNNVQQCVLRTILAENANTWFGKHHQFAGIRSVREYQRAVPLATYADFQTVIDRIVDGEQQVLTADLVDYLQLTSGSVTGSQKTIPSTSSFRKRVWYAVLSSQGWLSRWAGEHHIPMGPGIMAVSTLPARFTNAGIPCGLSAARHSLSVRRIWGSISVSPFSVTKIADAELRRYAQWRFALAKGYLPYLGSTYMVPLLASAETLFQRSQDLIRDVADGTFSADLALAKAEKEELEAQLRPLPNRAVVLEHIASQEGGLLPKKVWHDIGWLNTVYGPTSTSYEAQVENIYGNRFWWGMPYIACEGIVGLPFSANSYSHVPAVRSTFLEFIPEVHWDSAQPETVLVGDLLSGKRYEVVLTGWNGLYRYRLNDIIQVEGMFRGIPCIKIVARRDTAISIVWEKSTEAQVVEAVISCTRQCNQEFTDFVVDIDRTVVPPRYRLWLEPVHEQLASDALEVSFDLHLRKANPSYALLRDSRDISSPIVRFLPKGFFRTWTEQRVRDGAPEEQIKVLHAISHWTHAPEQDIQY